MTRRTTGWSEAIIAIAIVSAAVAAWIGREHVEAAASAVLGIGENGAARQGRRAHGRAPQPVVVATVVQGRNDVALEAIGTARAKQFVTLLAPIAGEVVKSAIVAGAHVKQGTVLVQLDSKKARLALSMAKSMRLDAERKLHRAEQLRRRNVNPDAIVDDARTAFERTTIALNQAEERLADLTVRAPFDGVVGIPKVEVGDRVTSATPLVSLDDRSELIVEFEVPERYLPRIRPGHPVEGRTPGFPREVFKGAVRSIDSRIDPVARSVTVRAALPNGDDRLRPGMSFTVMMSLPGQTYAKVPEVALQFSRSGNHVWVVADRKAKKVPVELIERADGYVLLDGALEPGTLVVIEGTQRLRPGRTVSFATEKEAAPKVQANGG